MHDEGVDFPRAAGRPARRALAAVGLRELAQVAGRSRAELLAIHGVGPRALDAIEAALAERGLRPLT
ncbi:DNA-binding protein [Spirilliplanes yamanashiensis]|uniref:DNA-binding protein n=1 Tax=Spirilliplanes yamanashiensis TaxID=42233 RepID=A0A8J3YCN4_9ACTN|nr:DNA-binding protein [Spirilliplanes yamanashiensis]MDP9818982.1 hypothetical protein [Spirilliplanes yamanashiensis]GIJ05437.1 hypothetical protein Sya03_47890 [Spirilliplanes yamanashiensis]